MARGARAYMRAARRRSSAAMPVIASTRSGVYSRTASWSSSKPSVRSSTYSLAHSPSARITWSMPFTQATSVPGRGRSQTWA